MTDSESNEYIRCRFTLTEEVHETLEKLANERFAGNKSALVRAAIQEKEDRPAPHEIRAELKSIRELIESQLQERNKQRNVERGSRQTIFNEQTKKFQNEMGNHPPDGDDTKTDPAKTARQLLNHLPGTEDKVVTFTELHDAIDASLPEVANGMEKLVERDQVEQTKINGKLAFRLPESEDS